MNKVLLFGTALLMATSVLAFGGGGKSRKSSVYRGVGVDSVDVHINGKGGACAAGVLEDRFGKCTVCANGNVYLSYEEDPCGTETSVTGCVSNVQCGENEYCNLTGSNCEQPDTGVCSPLNENDIKTTFDDGCIISQDSFSYWAAENWCAARGKQLIGLEDIGIDPSSVSGVIINGETCQESSGCHLDWQPVLDKISYNWFWVNDGIDICKSVYVRTFDKYIGPRDGRQGGQGMNAPALCK